MFSRIAAATLFLAFVGFVNLAAAITASFNRVETSVVASVAGIFQAFVDIGAVLVIGFVLVRAFVKLAQQAQMTPRPAQARQPEYRSTSQPVQRVNPSSWNPATPQPLPFDNHNAAEYTYTNQATPQQQTASQGVLENNIHRMRQQRDGYRMVR